MEVSEFLIFAAALLFYGLVSRRVESWWVTPPMLFAGIGFVFGGGLLRVCAPDLDHGVIKLLGEVTLALVLFTDAAHIDFGRLVKERAAPLRMLGFGLPGAIALGGLAALWLLPELGLWPAMLLGALLAPTDAALGQAVVNAESVPLDLRQSLEVESGLNDGIALPVVLMFLSLALMSEEGSAASWGVFALQQIGFGALMGIAVGQGLGRLVDRCSARGWMNDDWEQLSGLALALTAYAASESIGGNGFIAAFVAGLVLFGRGESRGKLLTYGHVHGEQLALLMFYVFGATLLPGALHHVDGPAVLYAVLSLTVVRMIPIGLSLMGSKTPPLGMLFLAWFGPRGLASILFTVLVLEAEMFEGSERIEAVVFLTVAISIVVHGLSALPFAGLFGKPADSGNNA